MTCSFLWLLSPPLLRQACQVMGLRICRLVFFLLWFLFPTLSVGRWEQSSLINAGLVHTSSPGNHTGKADAWPSWVRP